MWLSNNKDWKCYRCIKKILLYHATTSCLSKKKTFETFLKNIFNRIDYSVILLINNCRLFLFNKLIFWHLSLHLHLVSKVELQNVRGTILIFTYYLKSHSCNQNCKNYSQQENWILTFDIFLSLKFTKVLYSYLFVRQRKITGKV